jgi:hypothetical protein
MKNTGTEALSEQIYDLDTIANKLDFEIIEVDEIFY